MAGSKKCDMEASECPCSDKETVENMTMTHGDELMNTYLHVANKSKKMIPSNEAVDSHSELSAPSVRSHMLTIKGQEERIRHLTNEQITALKAVSRKQTISIDVMKIICIL